MGFKPISLEEYIVLHTRNNPETKEEDLRYRLYATFFDFMSGEKCWCGNRIWVVGSAVMGSMCYMCITGEEDPSEAYEIDVVLKQQPYDTDIHWPHAEIPFQSGFFMDDGTRIDLDSIKIPPLCLRCRNYNVPAEEINCQLNRIDQQDELDFECGSFRRK